MAHANAKFAAVLIDLRQAKSVDEAHAMLQLTLKFPDFYGSNWDAFWDAITGLVTMPRVLKLKGWEAFANRFPHDAAILKEIINDYNREHSSQILTD